MYFLKYCLVSLLLLSVYSLQDVKARNENDDVLVRLEGKIIDAATFEPVSAKLIYKMIPAGSVTGIRMFANANGNYHVQLQKYHQYKIEVSAEDYQPIEIVLNTEGNQAIENDFHLYKIPKKGEVFELSSKIYFERGEYSISEISIPTLQALGKIMQDHPDMKIRLEGHTDRGALRSLFHLSENRVKEVQRYMVEVMGIPQHRIKVKAFGGSKPISTENTIEARQQNRRVEVRVLKL
ncbi:OmpA family protein [Catalinimonas niigatensis]|uniref:OmpA family protein n=1 Tax=Catalinimonas niigatensis TaxID=1397264 RepID=UPI00266696D5|nr:OmpA family protein [Catalinimonas niigatensis]WPP52212.1 OmpA family protein [Catalinimonas niigatensis]